MDRASSPVSWKTFPTEVLKRIIHDALESPSAVLDDVTLVKAKNVFAFASSNSAIYQTFRSMFDSVHLTNTTPINISSVARLFGAALEHVTITGHPRPSYFLQSLKFQMPPLVSLSLALSYEDCFSTDALVDLLRTCTSTLCSLHLEGPVYGGKLPVHRIAPYLSKLHAFSLSNFSRLPYTGIFVLLSAPGRKLKRLRLRGLHHKGINDPNLRRIIIVCPNLTHLELIDVPYVTTGGAADLASLLHQTLTSFFMDEIDSYPYLAPVDLSKVFTNCTKLSHTSVCVSHETIAACLPDLLVPISTNLRSFSIRDLTKFTYNNIQRFSLLPMTALRELRLSQIPECHHLEIVLLLLGSQLHKLHIDYVSGSKEFLSPISHCKNLKNLCLLQVGGSHNTPHLRPQIQVVNKLLQDVGTELVHFTLTLRNLFDDDVKDGNRSSAESITYGSLALGLAKYCEKLKTVYIVGYKFPNKAILANPSGYDSFERLKKVRPELELYLDRPRPEFYAFESM